MRRVNARLLPAFLAVLLCAAVSLPSQADAVSPRRVMVPALAQSSFPHPPDLEDVACPSARVCYAVGYYGIQYYGTVFVTANAGHSWRRQSAGTRWGLRGVACVTTAICYGVGYAETTVVTTNGGRSWHDPHIPRSAQAISRVACPTSQMCVAVGNSPNRYTALVHRVLLTTDGGRSWSYPPTPIDRTAYPMNGIACPSARVCYAAGDYATIMVTYDGGHTWQRQHNALMDQSGVIIPTLSAIACSSMRSCVAVGGIENGVVLATNDGGRTWMSQTGVTRSSLTGVACPSPRVCYAVGYGGTLAMTRDGGRSWTQIDSGTQTFFNSIACHGVNFCVVVGNAGYIGILAPHAHSGRSATPTPAPVQPTPTPQPAIPPAPTPTTGATACTNWNVAGSWTWGGDPAAAGPGNSGNGSLTQSGTALSGTLDTGGSTWTLQGSISGSAVTLTMSAPGQIDLSFSGTVSADGTTIAGNLGSFTGGHARCQ